MEGHKQKGAGLARAVGTPLYDRVGPKASSGDLVEHAARGVNDKYQCRDLLHTEKSAKVFEEIRTY